MAKVNLYEFSPKTRKIIYERDNNCCVVCSGKTYLGIAHVFVPRSKGGLGIIENGALLCQECHHAMDNGSDPAYSDMVRYQVEQYMRARYDINNVKLKYNKWEGYQYE